MLADNDGIVNGILEQFENDTLGNGRKQLFGNDGIVNGWKQLFGNDGIMNGWKQLFENDGWKPVFENNGIVYYCEWQESMSVGCIPVIIGNDTDLPFQDYIEYDKFVLCVSERDAIKPGQLKRILQAINPERINSMISWMSVYRDGILYDRDELYHHLVRSLQKSLSHPR